MSQSQLETQPQPCQTLFLSGHFTPDIDSLRSPTTPAPPFASSLCLPSSAQHAHKQLTDNGVLRRATRSGDLAGYRCECVACGEIASVDAGAEGKGVAGGGVGAGLGEVMEVDRNLWVEDLA
jgi:hypothetical protein